MSLVEAPEQYMGNKRRVSQCRFLRERLLVSWNNGDGPTVIVAGSAAREACTKLQPLQPPQPIFDLFVIQAVPEKAWGDLQEVGKYFLAHGDAYNMRTLKTGLVFRLPVKTLNSRIGYWGRWQYVNVRIHSAPTITSAILCFKVCRDQIAITRDGVVGSKRAWADCSANVATVQSLKHIEEHKEEELLKALVDKENIGVTILVA